MATQDSPATMSRVDWSFPTVAAMKAERRYGNNARIRTAGYFTATDDGGARYRTTLALTYLLTNPAPDGILDHLTDDGTWVLLLQHGRSIDARWAGVLPDEDGNTVERRARAQAAWYRIADMSRDTRLGAEPTVFFDCPEDFLFDGTIHLSKSDGSPCEVNGTWGGRKKAVGGGAFEAHYGGVFLTGGKPRVQDHTCPPIPAFNNRVQRAVVDLGELDCNFWCDGVRQDTATGSTCSGQDLYHFRKYGFLTPDLSNNAFVVRWNNVKQWLLGDDDAHDFGGRMGDGGNVNQDNYIGDCYVCLQKDHRIWGGHWGWSRTAILMLDDVETRGGRIGEDSYYDALATGWSDFTKWTGDGTNKVFTLNMTGLTEDNTRVRVGGVIQDPGTYVLTGDTLTFTTAPGNGLKVLVQVTGISTSKGCGDLFLYGLHLMQGYGGGATSPRYDNVEVGGPILIENFNSGNRAFAIGCDLDAGTIQMYGDSLQFSDCSYISGGSNRFPDDDGENADRVVVIDPRIRYYADGTNNPSGGAFMACPGVTVGIYNRTGYSSFNGDYTAWNLFNQPAGAVGTLGFKKFLAYDAAGRTARGLVTANCALKMPNDALVNELYLVAQDMDVLADNSVVLRGAGGTVAFQLDRGDYVICTATYAGNTAGNWIPGSMTRTPYNQVPARQGNYSSEVLSPRYRLWPRFNASEPIEYNFRPAGAFGKVYDIAGQTFEWWFDGTAFSIEIAGTALFSIDANGVRHGNWYVNRNGGELTIASGAILPTSKLHTVDTEGDAASDELVNILATNAPAGAELFLRTENNGRDVVIKHGTGNIICNSGADFTLANTNMVAHLIRFGTFWICVNG